MDAMSSATSAAELKTQGVFEAAADPNSSVTADDAQRKLVAESRKAGEQLGVVEPGAKFWYQLFGAILTATLQV